MFESMLKEIKPTKKEEEELNSKVAIFLRSLNDNLKEGKIVVGGSFAKGTWLRGQHDLDIFVQYPNEEKISDKLETAIKKTFRKYQRIHGSRDYFIIEFEKIIFEVIPVLKIKSSIEAKNITDISPLHVEWVNKNLSDKMKDDVRIAKQFSKANKFYGAETFIKGLHGYVLEILIYHYGSFLNMVKNVSKWRENMLINFGKNEFYSEQHFPLVLIDPVNPKRNATASLSEEKLNLFIKTCKDFNKNKSLKYFKEQKINEKKYNLIIEAEPLEGSRDVAGTKILKVHEYIEHKLKNEGYEIKNTEFEFKEKGKVYFNIKNKKLPKYKKHYGPPITMKEGLENFKKKYGKYKTEKGKAYVMLINKNNKLEEYIKKIIKDEEVKTRVKKIKILKM